MKNYWINKAEKETSCNIDEVNLIMAVLAYCQSTTAKDRIHFGRYVFSALDDIAESAVGQSVSYVVKQNLVCAACEKMGEFDPSRDRPLDYFTTIMLNLFRQVYRSQPGT